MNINVTGRQLEITPAIREYAENKLSEMLADKTIGVTSVNAVLEYSKGNFSVSLVVNCNQHVFSASTGDFNLYKAFDAAVQKVEAQITKMRDKRNEHAAAPMREAEKSAE